MSVGPDREMKVLNDSSDNLTKKTGNWNNFLWENSFESCGNTFTQFLRATTTVTKAVNHFPGEKTHSTFGINFGIIFNFFRIVFYFNKINFTIVFNFVGSGINVSGKFSSNIYFGLVLVIFWLQRRCDSGSRDNILDECFHWKYELPVQIWIGPVSAIYS